MPLIKLIKKLMKEKSKNKKGDLKDRGPIRLKIKIRGMGI